MIPSKISLLVVDAMRYDCINYLPLKKTLEKDNVLQYLNTPTLDELCKESVCFTNCYSTAVGTSQVIASMFTGTTPINHGITHNSPSLKLILNQNTITLAEILKKLGYLTIIAGDPPKHLKSHQVFRGFDFEFTDSDEKLFKFLNEHKDDKVFLFCLFEDVHAPYLYSFKPPYEGYNNDIKKSWNQSLKNIMCHSQIILLMFGEIYFKKTNLGNYGFLFMFKEFQNLIQVDFNYLLMN